MTSRPTDAWTSDQAYEPYIGRWSRQVAPRFLRWLPDGPPSAWCDVGCGTGALAQTILSTERPIRVLAVDPSEAYLGAVRRGTAGLPLEAAVGTATAIPAKGGDFDRVVSGLVLNFVPQPDQALTEMRRVARPGGLVAAYVWDYAEGMQLIRMFWDAAVAVDPAAAELDEGRRFPLCRPEPLRAVFGSAGLVDVRVEAIDVPTPFTDFEDLWRPFLGGQGPAPGYCTGLPEDRRTALRNQLRATLPEQPTGRSRSRPGPGPCRAPSPTTARRDGPARPRSRGERAPPAGTASEISRDPTPEAALTLQVGAVAGPALRQEVPMGSFDVLLDDERTQLEAFVEEYRSALDRTLDGLTDEQARSRLVPSATTLLGLLKHVTWMQRVWFEECIGGRLRRELGLVQSPEESFRLADDDTVAGVRAAHRQACATARAAVADLSLEAVVTGHRAGPRTVRWVYLQVLRELAHHCGHADILREQVLAG